MNRTATIHKLAPRSPRRRPRSAERSVPRLEVVASPSRERRHGGPSQDRALYSCSCGLAFDALVSTSVGCPHCGRTQAW
jgi:hypothetical protein